MPDPRLLSPLLALAFLLPVSLVQAAAPTPPSPPATQTRAAQAPATTPAQPAAPPPAGQLEDKQVQALALKIYAQMRAGKVDPALLTPQMNQALTPEKLAETKPMLDQLGDPSALELQRHMTMKDGIEGYDFAATFPVATLHIRIFMDRDKVAGYYLAPKQ